MCTTQFFFAKRWPTDFVVLLPTRMQTESATRELRPCVSAFRVARTCPVFVLGRNLRWYQRARPWILHSRPYQLNCISLCLFTVQISRKLWSLYTLSAWILESGTVFEVAHCRFLKVLQTQFMHLYLYVYTVFKLMYSSSYHLDFNSGTQQSVFNHSTVSFPIMTLRCNTAF